MRLHRIQYLVIWQQAPFWNYYNIIIWTEEHFLPYFGFILCKNVIVYFLKGNVLSRKS